MPLQPLEIQKQRFALKLRGYDPTEVENFLGLVAEELSQRLAEQYPNYQYKNQYQLLAARLLSEMGRREESVDALRSAIAAAPAGAAKADAMVQLAITLDTLDRKSSTGGYQLIIESDVPLLGDLNTRSGRDVIGIRDSADPIWQKAQFASFRVWRGQDISCLNITRPTSPTIRRAML